MKRGDTMHNHTMYGRIMAIMAGLGTMAAVFLSGCGNATSSGAAEAGGNPDTAAFEALFGAKLVTAEGAEVATTALDGKKVGIYFSAQWCPPCRLFTPRLVETYNALKAEGKPFEIVFVSSDSSHDAMLKYMKEYGMDWMAVPFDSGQREALSRRYGVRGIPTLIVVDAAGETLSTDARNEVAQLGAQAYARW